MKQIGNWVFGSFFRTIGRLLVFIILGIIIANFIDFGSLKDNFSITDLFFTKVDALEYSIPVRQWGSVYTTTNDSNWTLDTNFYTRDITSNNNMQIVSYVLASPINASSFDYISFTLSMSQPLQVNTSSTTTSTIYGDDYCDRWEWRTIDSHNQVIEWDCERVVNSQNSDITDREYIEYIQSITNTNISARLQTQSNGWEMCTFNDTTIVCPTRGGTITQIDLYINFKATRETTFKLGISRMGEQLKLIDTTSAIDNNTNAINSQSQQQQQQHQEIMDSNTTQANSSGEDFINNFSNNTHGLTGIITAPLNAIQSLASATCSNLVLPLPFVNNKSLTLPCMSTIYSQHFGTFYTMYQGIILALISYWVCIRLFTLVKGFKDPEDDKIEVMDL